MSRTPTNVEWEQVKGYSKYLVSTDGQVYSIEKDIILLQRCNTKGYLRVQLRNDLGERKLVFVHRLVYMAHRGEIQKGLQINHLDENKTNNCIENLEMITPKENMNYGTGNKRRSKTMRKAWKYKSYLWKYKSNS